MNLSTYKWVIFGMSAFFEILMKCCILIDNLTIERVANREKSYELLLKTSVAHIHIWSDFWCAPKEKVFYFM